MSVTYNNSQQVEVSYFIASKLKTTSVKNFTFRSSTLLHARYTKYVRNLLAVSACGDHCVLATKAAPAPNNPPNAAMPGAYVLVLCNAIGTPLDSRHIDLEPVFVAMTRSHVIAASRDAFYTWQYRTLAAAEASKAGRNALAVGEGRVGHGVADLGGSRKRPGTERIYHVDGE